MECGKYIIVDTMGHETAIMFDGLISHADFLDSFLIHRIKAAGFFASGAKPSENDPDDISVSVWGKSVTLNNIGARKDIDEKLIKRVLRKPY